jgi:peptidoglycan/xylan/chitin deacetylase (PgdA/CDA1 family)
MSPLGSLATALASPILTLLRSINPTSAILFMHGVTQGDPVADVFNLHIRQDVFEAICRYLKAHYEVVGIDDLAGILMAGGKVPQRTVVLTFDDGYRNNLLNALPVLQAFDLPASVYISTRHISEGTIPVALKVRLGLAHTDLERMALPSLDRSLDLGGDAQRQSALAYLLHLVRTQPQDRVNALGADIEGLLPAGRWQEVEALYADDLRMMNWDDIRALSAAGISIGTHCHDHCLMHGAQSESEIRRQIAVSRQLIEENTGKPCRHFVYPHGSVQNICRAAVRELESQGIQTAMTTITGTIESSSNRLLLRRLHVSAVARRLFAHLALANVHRKPVPGERELVS